MIISASRRTDIPAFYTEWFMNRIRAGFCEVPSGHGKTRVTLDPKVVDAIVFWTRNPKPLLPHLDELDRLGHRYYFQYTITGAPRLLEPKAPPLDHAIATFQELSKRIGPERVIWRYDPIVITSDTLPSWHVNMHSQIADALHTYTTRCVISLVDFYRKASNRLKALPNVTVYQPAPNHISDSIARMTTMMAHTARQYGMSLEACSENGLLPYGASRTKCIDDDLLYTIFGIDMPHTKDMSQRAECNCIPSCDIGAYDTCTFGCTYCYATNLPEVAQHNHRKHNPQAPSLLG